MLSRASIEKMSADNGLRACAARCYPAAPVLSRCGCGLNYVRPQRPAVDPKEHTEHLRTLAGGPKTASARAELTAALESKHEGFRVVAAQALCSWADAESLGAVKLGIWDLAAQPHRWAAVGAMCKALAPHLKTTQDLDWAVDLFSSRSHYENRYYVGAALFEAFAPKMLLPRLRALESTANGHNWQTHVRGLIARAEYRQRTEV